MELFGSLIYTIISSANRDNLTSSFPICIPLTSFCCLIPLARTSSTKLNKYGENRIEDAEMNPHTYGHLIFDKGATTIQWKKSLSINDAGPTRGQHAEECKSNNFISLY